MTADDILWLREGSRIFWRSYQKSGIRGEVTQVTQNFVRIDWKDSAKSYDILRRTSPFWSLLELVK